jgi:hypothetical protein
MQTVSFLPCPGTPLIIYVKSGSDEETPIPKKSKGTAKGQLSRFFHMMITTHILFVCVDAEVCFALQ